MSNTFRFALTSLAATALLTACGESPSLPEVQQTASSDARPRDATANLPSDSGSQTTLPSGAVTGAGQPQGKGVQPDVGAAGGLERRARQEERRSTAASGDVRARGTDRDTPSTRESAPVPERPARQSRG